MVRESAWKRTKAYIRRMRSNRAGGWIALLLLFLVEVQCVTSTTAVTNETIQYRLPLNVIPTSYDVKLTPLIDEGNFTFNGETKISIKVLNETSNITLHACYDLEMNENATILMDADGKLIKPMGYNRENKTDFLILNFEQSLKPGNYSLSLKFSGNISSDPVGIYRTSYINAKNEKIWLVATRFSPTKARRAFPCWDEPALKATFNISIKHSPNYTAASNMPIKNQIDTGSGKKWTMFNTTPLMSTYLVAFVVSDFQCISNANKSINTCVQKEALPAAKFVQELTKKALPLLEEYTGISYPLPKLDSYIIPGADSGGMENWGLIIYPAYTLLNKNSTCAAKEAATDTYIRELANQWFGNLVTPAWWKYIWMKVGFSRFLKFYIGDKIFPQWELMNQLVSRVLQKGAFWIESSNYYNYLNWNPKSPAEIKSHASMLVYEKAPIMIHMLSHIVGEQGLREGIQEYLKKHQYGVVTPDDLWAVMPEIYDSSEEIKIKDVMNPWFEQKGYPIVKVVRNYENGTAVVTQSPNLASESSNKWYIPINFATESEPSCTCTLPTHWLKPNDTNVTIKELNKDDWLIVNLKQSGYYRVDYDEANWLKIAKYLNSENFTNIHVLNRVQIMSDLLYMVTSDRQNFTTFLEVIKYLSREVDYIPWSQVFDSFLSLKSKFYDRKFFDNLKKYTLTLMKNVVEKIGFEERSTDTYMMKRWRSEILTSACCYGHRECRKIAGDKLVAFLENPQENPMPPNLELWILTSGIYSEKAQILMQEKIENGAYQYMRYLNVAKNHTFYREFIEKAMTNSSIPKNATRTAFAQMKNGGVENWDYTVDYFINNSERIYKYFNNTRMAASILNDCIWIAPTSDRLQKISEYVDKHNERTFLWMKNAIAQQTKKLEWSKTHAPIFNNWLEKELVKTASAA
ncbi:hypothetical protein PV328_006162 [Microctonus aethiopoides]|uniref:Aminopeptidase n=1 Tax=Microctonus aethiopoides TaxID=144406 RepID=A0AA39FNI6_9HYME|nr:hypothetical protein PV328_006162 [Microctonus aethiopoides]